MTGTTDHRGIFPRFETLFNRMIFITCYVVLAIGLLLTAITSVEVFSRYVTNSSLIFVEELSRFLLIWFSYLGAVLALHEGGHVGVDFLRQWLGDSLAGRGVRLFNIAVMAVFLGAMLYGSLLMMPMLRDQRATTLDISMVMPYLSMTLGSFLMLVRLSYSLACLVTGREERLLTITAMLSRGDRAEAASMEQQP